MTAVPKLIHRFFTEHQWHFWALNVFGWAGYGFFSILGALVWDKDLFQQLVFALIATLTGFLVTLLMRALILRCWDLSSLKRGFATLGIVGLASGLWALFKLVYFYELLDFIGSTTNDPKLLEMAAKSWGVAEYLSWFTYSFFILLSWTALYYGIKFYQALQKEKQRLAAMTLMAHEAQLKMLRYQLNPHFLFNTLNAISTLVLDHQNSTANAMITSLAKFLRHTLESDPMQKVPLEEEVRALRLYLDIEQIRFEDRLALDFDIDEAARKALVPSLLLQPLVENAIKYAISKSEAGGTISLHAHLISGKLRLQLSDDGPGLPVEQQASLEFSGVGIRNFRQRLKEIYGAEHSCLFSQGETGGLVVTVVIPAEYQEERPS